MKKSDSETYKVRIFNQLFTRTIKTIDTFQSSY